MGMIKTGLDYFPLNLGFFEDDKIQLVTARFGLQGEDLILRLLCKIYTNGYFCKFGTDELLLFSNRLGNKCSISFVKDLLKELLSRDFFDREIYDKYKILTSRGIQRRYFDITSRRKSVCAHIQLLLMNTSELTNVYIYTEDECKISSNGDIFLQRKEKKRKLKKSTHEASESTINDVDCDYDKFLDWIEEHAPYCASEDNFPHQITLEEFRKLRAKYTGKQIAYVIEQLENHRDLRKRYSNLYRTVLNWAQREYEN